MEGSARSGHTGVDTDGAAQLLLDLVAGLAPSGSDVPGLLAGLVDAAGRLPEVGGAGTMWSDQGRLRHAAATGTPMARLQELQAAEAAGPSMDAFRSNVTIHVIDLADAGGRWPAVARAARELDTTGFVALPLSDSTGARGVLSVSLRPGREWSGVNAVVLGALADLVAAGVAHHEEWERLSRTAGELRHALEARVIVEQAKGILAESQGVTVDRALTLLRSHARGRGRSLKAVAADVVAGRLQLGSSGS